MSKTQTELRREKIKDVIYESDTPISASALARQFNVSRQIVVGDIALLRAAQEDIIATPRGYLYQKANQKDSYVIASCHDKENTLEELYTIVDCGGSIENVIVSHPVYGELVGPLHIHNRVEAKEFVETCEKTNAKNLSEISDGVHLHTICVSSQEQYTLICEELEKKGFLYKK